MFSKEQLIELFGIEWFEVLGEYLNSPNFTTIAIKLAELRRTKEIYPKKGVFKCFKETPYSKIKCVIVGQEPFIKEEYNDGLAFSNSLSKDISPTLKIILKEVDNCYPENVDRIDYGKLDLQNLIRWTKQGVMLYNTSLTVEKGKVASHLELWKPFTIKIIQTLNTKNDIIWLFLGKESQFFTKFVTNSSHTVILAAHPAVSCYGGTGFFGSDCFKKINFELLARNRKEIIW